MGSLSGDDLLDANRKLIAELCGDIGCWRSIDPRLIEAGG
jgi:hypothetical protein